MLVSVALWSVLGCAARVATEHACGAGATVAGAVDADTVLVPSFFSNVVGCTVLGLLVASLASVPKKGAAMVLFTGVTTGFCGACTTFGSWVLQTNEPVRSLRAWLAQLGSSGTVDPSNDAAGAGPACRPPLQVRSLLYMASGLACFIVAHRLGMDVGAPAAAAAAAAFGRLSLTGLHRFNAVALAGALAASAAAAAFDASSRHWWLAGLLAPVGAIARYSLAARLNGWVGGRFPLGTFTANVAGSTAAALLAVWAGHWEEAAWEGAVWQAVGLGFLGSFTTMSTLVNEVATIRRGFSPLPAFAYIAATVLTAHAAAGWVQGAAAVPRGDGRSLSAADEEEV